MKRISLLIVSITLSMVCIGQVKPEKFLGIATIANDSAYYARQAEVWHGEILKNPKNETAWKYYYMASHYVTWFQDEEGTEEHPLDHIMQEMGKAIPDTYTYNYCMYRETRLEDGGDTYADKALKMLPKEKDFFDYDIWTTYLFLHNRIDELRPIAKAYYNSGIYSKYVLESSSNELAALEPNAIYVGTADIDFIPKLLLIYGKGERSDVNLVLGGAALLDEDHLDYTLKSLNIDEPFEIEIDEDFASLFESDEELDEYMASYSYYTYDTVHFIYKFIMSRTGRPMYFSRFSNKEHYPWYNYLDGDGFALRYRNSSTMVNINEVVEIIKTNCEEKYNLDFLRRPTKDEAWISCETLAGMWVEVLDWLAVKYKKDGDTKKLKSTTDLLRTIYEGMGYTSEEVDNMMQETEDFIEDNQVVLK